VLHENLDFTVTYRHVRLGLPVHRVQTKTKGRRGIALPTDSTMWFWRKKNREERQGRSVAGAALAGASRAELLRAAVQDIAAESRADRVGVWLEPESPQGRRSSGYLRGMVWDRHEEQSPVEWESLSLESPIPGELLASARSVEQELNAAADRPVFGPLLGLHYVLWSPVHSQSRLRGIVLTGWQSRPLTLPQAVLESVTSQLALASERQEQQELAQEYQADLRLHQQIMDALGSKTSPDTILHQLAHGCAELVAEASGSHAGFVVIGHFPSPSLPSTPREMEFAWQSGDATWTYGLHTEPLAGLGQKALQSRCVEGMEPPATWSASGLGRIVAIPLMRDGRALGVVLAGLPKQTSSLQMLRRLELRALLVSIALERLDLDGESRRHAARQEALLERSSEATVLLNRAGGIAALNRTARILLEDASGFPRITPPSSTASQNPAAASWCIGGRFEQLFCAREQSRVAEWSRRALAADSASRSLLPFEAELLTGIRVRLHAPLAVGDDLAAVVLNPAASEQAASRQKRSQTDLQHVLEWVEEGVVLFDADQSIRAMNTRFAQIAGLSAEEASACVSLEGLIQRLAPRAADPTSFALRWQHLARTAEGGLREEVPLARPVPRVLERSIRPVLSSAGQRLGRLEIYRDLTAQRVFQAKLLQTEKLAALGQMITGVAHELSNPLTSILGYSQRLLVRNDLAGRNAEAFQIHEEAERASAILRQLLLTARETQPERKRVSLNQVVQKTMELQRFGSAAEKVRMELDLDPSLPFVVGDSGQLQQVLMNLIGNARQAIAHEGRPGTVRLRTTRTGEHRVQLQVADDGPGIPQTILARIFDPFFTTKPAGVGTGLGLSIVLSVVREHGGQVHVANSPSGGAIFTIELPVAAEPSADSPGRSVAVLEVTRSAQPGFVAQKSRPRLGVPSLSHDVARVLVVEDEPTVARLIADVLEDEGMRVDVLLDGREALDRAVRERFDLIVCDMKMPGIDGQHFYRSLAQKSAGLQDRFLFVTGDVLAPQTQEFLERNRIPYVAKPFRVEELTERIRRLFDGRSTRAERAAAAKQIG